MTKKKKPLIKKQVSQLSQSETLYGFFAWLTTRSCWSGPFGANLECSSQAVELIQEFIKANKLKQPRKGWENNFKFPLK